MTTESAGQAREVGDLEGLTPEEHLKALGLELPSVPSAVGDYEPWVEVNGVIYTSGQLPCPNSAEAAPSVAVGSSGSPATHLIQCLPVVRQGRFRARRFRYVRPR